MPKVYSVIEVQSKSWGLMVGALTFFISLSLVLGILLPAERTRRKEAEEARERLTMHAHRLAQVREELQKQLTEERQNKESILAMLRETQTEVASLRGQLTAQADQLKTLHEASAKSSQRSIEIFPRQKSGGVTLGRVVVGKNEADSP
jgi:septal ring factor EnvC (AmiA/AmiB activator)